MLNNEYLMLDLMVNALRQIGGEFQQIFPTTRNPFHEGLQGLAAQRSAIMEQAIADEFYLSDPRTNQAWAIYQAQNEIRKELGGEPLPNITTVAYYNAEDKKEFVTLKTAELWVSYNHRILPREVLYTQGALNIRIHTNSDKYTKVWSQTTLPNHQWERQAPRSWDFIPLPQEIFQIWLTQQLLVDDVGLQIPPTETADIEADIARKREWLKNAVEVIGESDEWKRFDENDESIKRKFRCYRKELQCGKESRQYVNAKIEYVMDKSPPPSTLKGLIEVLNEEYFIEEICDHLQFDRSRLVIPSWSSNVQS